MSSQTKIVPEIAELKKVFNVPPVSSGTQIEEFLKNFGGDGAGARYTQILRTLHSDGFLFEGLTVDPTKATNHATAKMHLKNNFSRNEDLKLNEMSEAGLRALPYGELQQMMNDKEAKGQGRDYLINALLQKQKKGGPSQPAVESLYPPSVGGRGPDMQLRFEERQMQSSGRPPYQTRTQAAGPSRGGGHMGGAAAHEAFMRSYGREVKREDSPMREDPMREDPMREDPMRGDPMREDPMREDPMREDSDVSSEDEAVDKLGKMLSHLSTRFQEIAQQQTIVESTFSELQMEMRRSRSRSVEAPRPIDTPLRMVMRVGVSTGVFREGTEDDLVRAVEPYAGNT